MTLYSAPPPARSFRDDKATLLVCWWCTIFAAVIIIFRICGRYIRTERLFKEDWLAFACMIPLFSRMALVHIVLLYGTNNTQTFGLSEESIRRRVIGSKLVLVSRIFYAATLWMLKLTISEFFKRLISNIWRRSYEITLICIRWFLLATFIAVVIADLAECRPTSHYWQVVPDPGPQCRQGYAQLITMGTADVITDFLLVIFPASILIPSKMTLKRKIQLVLLFAGSLLPAGTTLFRIPHIIDLHGSQQYRSLLASVEILFATAIANALVLGSFVRDKGVKKQRWKFGSLSDSIERTTSRRGTAIRHWGSDEDLVRDLGISVDPELRTNDELSPRPAPMATSGHAPHKARKLMGDEEEGGRRASPVTIRRDWQFPGTSDTSDEIDLYKILEHDHSPGEIASLNLNSPRKVSFFDVGGLLDDDKPRRESSTRTMDSGESSSVAQSSQWSMNAPHQTQYDAVGGLSPPPNHAAGPRRGSQVFLQDIGGLLGPPRRDSGGGGSRGRGRGNGNGNGNQGFELQDMLREGSISPTSHPSPHVQRQQQPAPKYPTANTLQDVGGLLKGG